jgi:DNA polymerase-4/DNA polymerase V
MNEFPISIASYPNAILHVDADAFFASVEQALNPSLQGKPVVTGKERGIIACASYEAKAMGIKRGIPLFQARQLCPALIILPNDYETYSLYSKRMFNIMRTFTPLVEEYSIDEAFADIKGLRRIFRSSYEDIALKIKHRIHEELGITVSVGLSLSKSLAKLCSKLKKPNGFVPTPGRSIHKLLIQTPLKKVWGFGPNTVTLLEKYGLHTAYDFVTRPETWVKKLLGKPGHGIWHELRGNEIWKVSTEEKTSYGSIIKSKTFTPASGEKSLVHAKLMRNVESAFIKARRYRLCPKFIGIVLRHSDFHHDGLEARLSRPASCFMEITPVVKSMFDTIFTPGCEYRATMVILGMFENDIMEQYDLFEDRLKIESFRRITAAIDTLDNMFGKHTISSGTSLFLSMKQKSSRDEVPARRATPLRGENERKRIGIPRFSIKV